MRKYTDHQYECQRLEKAMIRQSNTMIDSLTKKLNFVYPEILHLCWRFSKLIIGSIKDITEVDIIITRIDSKTGRESKWKLSKATWDRLNKE